ERRTDVAGGRKLVDAIDEDARLVSRRDHDGAVGSGVGQPPRGGAQRAEKYQPSTSRVLVRRQRNAGVRFRAIVRAAVIPELDRRGAACADYLRQRDALRFPQWTDDMDR